MSNDFTYRQYRDGDENSIVKLLLRVFKVWPDYPIKCSPVDHWKWKYLDIPSEHEMEKGIILCERDDELVAVAHNQYFIYKIGDELVWCSISPDVAVKREYRGKGIFTKMRDIRQQIRIKQGIEINLGYSENPILVARSKRHNTPEFPYNVKTYVRIHDIDLHFKYNEDEASLVKNLGFRTMKALNSITHLVAESKNTQTSLEISRFDERIDAFWIKIQEDYDFIRQQDMEFLNWRYMDPRGSSNIARIIVEDDAILGYVIMSVNDSNPDYPVGVISDINSQRGRDDVVDSLISDSLNYFDENGVNIVKCRTVSGNPLQRSLSSHGFLDSLVRPRMTIRQITPHDLSRLYKNSPERIHMSYGNFDTL